MTAVRMAVDLRQFQVLCHIELQPLLHFRAASRYYFSNIALTLLTFLKLLLMRYPAILIVVCVALLSGCKKSEGLGGKASVTGVVNEEVWRVGGMGLELKGVFGSQGTDVQVIYGADEGVFDDKIETGYNGKFEINYLRPGDYTVYVYSDCWDCDPGVDSVVKVSFNIPDKTSEIDLGEILILNR